MTKKVTGIERIVLMVGGLIGGIIVGGALATVIEGYKNKIITRPAFEQPAEGFANPDKLEFEFKDINNKKGNETILRYDGLRQLLKAEEDGSLQFYKYTIENSKIEILE